MMREPNSTTGNLAATALSPTSMRSFGFLISACLAIACYFAAPPLAHAAEQEPAPPKSVAVLDFELVNDMQEYDSAEVAADQKRRLTMVSDELRREFAQRGMYKVVDNSKAAEQIAKARQTYNLRDCPGCAVEIGKALGADRVVQTWVQKVSNLILNLNIVVKNVATGEVVYNKSVDLRGNTDLSWQRGIKYMVDSIAAKKQYLK